VQQCIPGLKVVKPNRLYLHWKRLQKPWGGSLTELIQSDESMSDINSVDKSLMEKVRLLEALNDEERKTIDTMLDEFIG
jgi:hypothetical protein